MKLKHLESALSSIDYQFSKPRIELEQYPTSAEPAAAVTFTAYNKGDLGENIIACDLGCGTGMLTIACALLGCGQVFAVDCDENAIRQAQHNTQEMDMDLEHVVNFIRAELKFVPSTTVTQQHRGGGGGGKHRGSGGGKGRRGGGNRGESARDTHPKQDVGEGGGGNIPQQMGDGIPLASKCVDTVLINPPFGTKHNAGVDVAFLACGCRIARKAVYSFHKTSTRKFLLKKATEEWGMGAEVVAEMKFDIGNTYKFHKKKSVDIEVDLLRLWHLDVDSEEG